MVMTGKDDFAVFGYSVPGQIRSLAAAAADGPAIAGQRGMSVVMLCSLLVGRISLFGLRVAGPVSCSRTDLALWLQAGPITARIGKALRLQVWACRKWWWVGVAKRRVSLARVACCLTRLSHSLWLA